MRCKHIAHHAPKQDAFRTFKLTKRTGSVKIEAYIFNQTTQNTTEHITRLSYQPGTGLGMGDMYAPLMGGILGTLLASIILFASVWTGDTRVNISLTGKTVGLT